MNNKKKKGVIGILTGGGDVLGLNPAIRAVTIRALREGYKVIGLRRGWAGIVELIRDKKIDNSNNFIELTEEVVNKAGRSGGTFLHSSRTRPSHMPKEAIPKHLQDVYNKDINEQIFGDLVLLVEDDIHWLANNYGLKVEDICQVNIDKLKARYGEKFSSERAINRDLDTERNILEEGNSK